MKEYIELKKRVAYTGDVFNALLGLGWAVQETVEFCDKLPAADVVERNRGEWIDTRKLYGDYMCSNCEALYGTNKFNFCPNCGCQMVGVKDGRD